MFTLNSYPHPDPKVVGRKIEDEAVLVLPHLGKINVVNDVGALIWEMCDGQHSVQQIVEAVCQQYDIENVKAEQDTLQFLDALAQCGAIT